MWRRRRFHRFSGQSSSARIWLCRSTRDRIGNGEEKERQTSSLTLSSFTAGDDLFTCRRTSKGGGDTDEDGFALPSRVERARASAMPIYPPFFLPSFLPSSFSPLLASSFWGGFHSQFLDQVEVFSSSFDRVGYRSTKIVAPMSCIYILSTSSSE